MEQELEKVLEARRRQMNAIVEGFNVLGLTAAAFEFNDDSGHVWEVEFKCQKV